MKHHTENLTPEENAAIERPSQDHTSRFLSDQEIRARGYGIKSRPKKGATLWQKPNDKGVLVTLTQTEVLQAERLG